MADWTQSVDSMEYERGIWPCLDGGKGWVKCYNKL